MVTRLRGREQLNRSQCFRRPTMKKFGYLLNPG
jgi:hypothetical protein